MGLNKYIKYCCLRQAKNCFHIEQCRIPISISHILEHKLTTTPSLNLRRRDKEKRRMEVEAIKCNHLLTEKIIRSFNAQSTFSK